MNDIDSDLSVERSRMGWWIFMFGLALLAALIAYTFVGILVLGIFGYYATRPINRHLKSLIDSDDIAAWTTVLLVLLPLILVLFYAGYQISQPALNGAGLPYEGLLEALPEDQRSTLQTILDNPRQLVSNPGQLLDTVVTVATTLSSGLLIVSLGITLTAFLLANDEGMAAGLRELFGGQDTTAYAYAATLDEDFASVFFGNFLFVLAMAVIATAVYWGTNLVAPAGLQVPMVFVLGFLTGIASLIPAIVGKVIYIPVVAYLGLQAFRTNEVSLAFVGGILVVYFLLLDFLPQTFLQPYLTGRQLDTVMMMFGYLLGPILFGWYGLFLLPMLFIVMLEAIRIVVPNLVHGKPLTTAVEMGDEVGTNPREERESVPEHPPDDEGETATDSDADSA